MDLPYGESSLGKKRKITEDPTDSKALSEPVLTRSSLFWLDDGNVVLQTPTTQYRVHKSVLMMQSTVFKDMFSIPQPAIQSTVDQSPVITLTDAAKDWDVLLAAFYHINLIYIVGTNVIGAPDMVAMLRLGQKYGFEKFKKAAHKQLRTIYPRSLQELDFILDESDESSHSNSQLRLVPVGDEFNILKTILELHIETVLPMAYYFCVRNRSLADICSGRDISQTSDDTVHLSAETRNTLVIGKEKILAKCPELTFAWWYKGKPSSSCISASACKRTINRVIRALTDVTLGVARALHPYNRDDNLCEACHAEAKPAHDIGRQAVIDALPSFFGLPTWDELKDL